MLNLNSNMAEVAINECLRTDKVDLLPLKEDNIGMVASASAWETCTSSLIIICHPCSSKTCQCHNQGCTPQDQQQGSDHELLVLSTCVVQGLALQAVLWYHGETLVSSRKSAGSLSIDILKNQPHIVL